MQRLQGRIRVVDIHLNDWYVRGGRLDRALQYGTRRNAEEVVDADVSDRSR